MAAQELLLLNPMAVNAARMQLAKFAFEFVIKEVLSYFRVDEMKLEEKPFGFRQKACSSSRVRAAARQFSREAEGTRHVIRRCE